MLPGSRRGAWQCTAVAFALTVLHGCIDERSPTDLGALLGQTQRLEDAESVLMRGNQVEAEAVSRDAVRIYRSQLGDDNSMVFFVKAHLADALRGQGRYREAEPLLLAAYRRFEQGRDGQRDAVLHGSFRQRAPGRFT